jgi:PHD/YefM family antitoxin component YafN of YafNO toxin-antitoxin module
MKAIITSPAMTITTSRQFNQDASGAKKAAHHGPVFITDRGKPAHVLMTINQYQRLSGAFTSIIDMLALPEGAESIEFDAPRAHIKVTPADLS